jgi:hypothetical protein
MCICDFIIYAVYYQSVYPADTRKTPQIRINSLTIINLEVAIFSPLSTILKTMLSVRYANDYS